MSRKERRQQNAQVYDTFTPAQQETLNEATTVVVEYETHKLNLLMALLQRFSPWKEPRQTAAVQRDINREIDRQVPSKNNWAVENGDTPPNKNTDWDNL